MSTDDIIATIPSWLPSTEHERIAVYIRLAYSEGRISGLQEGLDALADVGKTLTKMRSVPYE